MASKHKKEFLDKSEKQSEGVKFLLTRSDNYL